jgi:hypothetical protein
VGPRDVTNHFWEQQRIRRCSGGMIDAARRRALLDILMPFVGYHHEPAEQLANIYFGVFQSDAQRGPFLPPHAKPARAPTKADVVALLERHGLDESAIDIVATRMSVTSLSSMEGLIHKHRIRRDAILQEIERRREKRPAHRRPKALAQPNCTDPPQESSPPIAGAPA